jgi:hypothetical protein
MRTVNIFSSYKQENQFTNGLISLLELSKRDSPRFVTSFLNDLLSIRPKGGIDSFRVLRGIDGTADAELCGKDCCIRFETKIRSATLTKEQIGRHRRRLIRSPQKLKRLVLLTPDDGDSAYVKRFRSIDPTHILHLEWRRVYEFLEMRQKKMGRVFSELAGQFLELIHDTVFTQDIAGIVLKIDFGEKSGIYQDSYLDDMKTDADNWTYWNTPRQYKNLDGTGRKLIFYDRTRGITAEVEIKQVKRISPRGDYPWRNLFAPGTLRIFDQPITLRRIRKIHGFENFGRYRMDRSAFRNITQEQYRELIGLHR